MPKEIAQSSLPDSSQPSTNTANAPETNINRLAVRINAACVQRARNRLCTIQGVTKGAQNVNIDSTEMRV